MADTKKGSASGPRVPLVFGTGNKVVNKKKTTIPLVAKIPQSTITALDIKFKKAVEKGAAPKIIVDKAKRKRLSLPSSGTGSGRRFLRCSIDDIKFYNIIIPTGMGYGQAIVNLTAQSKARVFYTPSGERRVTGEIKGGKKTPKANKTPKTK